jgi:23S rRNA (pseudouridine1915-N3)-methyltransferase
VQIRIVAVGRIKEPGFVLAQAEYAKRLQRYVRLEIIEVDDEPVPAGDRQREAVKLREGERLQRRARAGVPASAGRTPAGPGTRVPSGRDCLLVALDSRGDQFTSGALAAWLGQHQAPDGRGHGDLTFMLGGALGLSPAVLAQAGLRLSLSSLTFPHQLARVVLLEQLYRAFRILRWEPYHY